jgi:hypothetical protein
MKTDDLLNNKLIKPESDENGFVVPDHYFETLKDEIYLKTVNKTIKKSTFKIWNLAAAASIIVIIGISLTIYLDSKNSSDTNSKSIAYNSEKQLVHPAQSHDTVDPKTENTTPTKVQKDNDDILDNELLDGTEGMDLTDEELIELITDIEI